MLRLRGSPKRHANAVPITVRDEGGSQEQRAPIGTCAVRASVIDARLCCKQRDTNQAFGKVTPRWP